MIRKIMEKAGFILMANAVWFSPIIAHADGGGGKVIGAVIGAGLGGFLTGAGLVSASRTKITATKAENYVDGDLELSKQADQFIRTTTEKHKVN